MRDRGLIDRLYRQYNENMVRHVRQKWNNHPLARDAVQSAWSDICKKENELSKVENMRAFLNTFAWRAMRDIVRAENRRGPMHGEMPELPCAGGQDSAHDAWALDRAINRLMLPHATHKPRPAMRLREITRMMLADMEHDEMKDALGVSQQAISQLKARAIPALQKEFGVA